MYRNIQILYTEIGLKYGMINCKSVCYAYWSSAALIHRLVCRVSTAKGFEYNTMDTVALIYIFGLPVLSGCLSSSGPTGMLALLCHAAVLLWYCTQLCIVLVFGAAKLVLLMGVCVDNYTRAEKPGSPKVCLLLSPSLMLLYTPKLRWCAPLALKETPFTVICTIPDFVVTETDRISATIYDMTNI